MATREEIDRVRSAVNIVDVISLHVALKRQGQIWKGLCPFHSEKTPSFNVNPASGSFHCFGCGKGGDAIKFLQESEGLTFIEALTRLADSVGIPISRTGGEDRLAGKRDRLFEALESAARFYQEMLARSETAKEYLSRRGVSPAMAQKFRLGYAPEASDALPAYLRRSRIKMDDAIEAGVLAKGDPQYGSVWDKLRGRIICPIIDIHDRPIAFGGRQMEDIKERPKYLNTAETPLFSKGKTFYAMSHARKAIVDLGYAVVVEGYFDVISAHQAGFNNVIATLGTALTDSHADQLLRHAQQVRLAFDADAAGVHAADRSAQIFEARGVEALVLDLPAGEDPDSLLRAGRMSDFQSAIENARPIREFKLRTILASISSKKRTEAEALQLFRREIMPVLLSTTSVIERDRYIRMCTPQHPMYGQGASFAENQIRQELQSAASGKARATSRYAAPGADRGQRLGQGRSVQGAAAQPLRGATEIAEENILRAMVSDEREIRDIVADGVQILDIFVSAPARRLARRLLDVRDKQQGIAGAVMLHDDQADGDEAVSGLASRIITGAPSSAPLTKQVVEDSMARLRRESLLHRERDLKALADSGDSAAAQEYMRLLRDAHQAGAR